MESNTSSTSSPSYLYIGDGRQKNTRSPCAATHTGYGVFIRNNATAVTPDRATVVTLSDTTDLPIAGSGVSSASSAGSNIVYHSTAGEGDSDGSAWAVTVLVILIILLGMLGIFLVWYNRKTGYVVAVLEWHRAWRAGHRVRINPSGEVGLECVSLQTPRPSRLHVEEDDVEWSGGTEVLVRGSGPDHIMTEWSPARAGVVDQITS